MKVRVRSHKPWGLSVAIIGHQGVGGSIDYLDIAGPNTGRPQSDDFPIGAEFEAVVRKRVGADSNPARWGYYLMIP